MAVKVQQINRSYGLLSHKSDENRVTHYYAFVTPEVNWTTEVTVIVICFELELFYSRDSAIANHRLLLLKTKVEFLFSLLSLSASSLACISAMNVCDWNLPPGSNHAKNSLEFKGERRTADKHKKLLQLPNLNSDGGDRTLTVEMPHG